MYRLMTNADATTATWFWSYANWCEGIGTSPVWREKGYGKIRIAFGAETHDAWRKGTSPDDFIRGLKA